MAVTGQNTSSLRKKDLVTQKSPTVAYNPLVFQHKATAGDTGINLALLSTPSEANQNGFIQPSVQRLAGAELKRNAHSLKLISSVGGLLQPYVSYVVSGSLQIRFIGFTALEGEIFTGYIDPTPVTGASLIDVSAVPKTGVLVAGQTDINIGEQYKVNLHPSQQVGQYQLEIDGVGQFRNTGNSGVVLDANYYEVDVGDGTGTLIRLNQAKASDVSYKLIPIGSVLERPAGSALTVIDQQQGVIDKLVEVVAAISGLEEAQIKAAPTYPDLKAFGDRVLDVEANRARIDQVNTWTAAQPLVGKTNGTSKASGEVGEVIFVEVGNSNTNGSNTLGTYTDLLSISPGPGIWNIEAYGIISLSGATGVGSGAYIVGDFALTDSANNVIRNQQAGPQNTDIPASSTPFLISYYVSLATTTTYKSRFAAVVGNGAPGSPSNVLVQGGATRKGGYIRATRVG